MKSKFHKFKSNISHLDLINILRRNEIKYELKGEFSGYVKGASSLDSLYENSLKWCKNETIDFKSYNNIIISNKNLKLDSEGLSSSNLFILVELPKYVYNCILNDLLESNLLSIDIELDNEVNVQNKNSSQISDSNTFVDPSTRIAPGVVIYPNVHIGKNCSIGPNSIIGAQGFGLIRNPSNGLLEKVLHIGGVLIGDNVSIASNTCIDAGMINETFIDSNVAIDNLVHISHNCKIMSGSIIAAGAVICGGTHIKKNVWVAPNAVALQNITIGENSVIGSGTVLRTSVPNNSMVYGNPMKIIRNYSTYKNNIKQP